MLIIPNYQMTISGFARLHVCTGPDTKLSTKCTSPSSLLPPPASSSLLLPPPSSSLLPPPSTLLLPPASSCLPLPSFLLPPPASFYRPCFSCTKTPILSASRQQIAGSSRYRHHHKPGTWHGCCSNTRYIASTVQLSMLPCNLDGDIQPKTRILSPIFQLVSLPRTQAPTTGLGTRLDKNLASFPDTQYIEPIGGLLRDYF